MPQQNNDTKANKCVVLCLCSVDGMFHSELCKVFVQTALGYTLTHGCIALKQNAIKTTDYGSQDSMLMHVSELFIFAWVFLLE